MAVQTSRHAARRSPPSHRLLDRLPAMTPNAALEERNRTAHMSGRAISPHDRFGSPSAIRKQDSGWQGIPVPVARSAQVRLHRAMQGFLPRVKPGREPGFPRFWAWSRYRSFRAMTPRRPEVRSGPGMRAAGPPGRVAHEAPAAHGVRDPAALAAAEPASGLLRRVRGAAGRGSTPVRTSSAGRPDGRAGAPSGCGHPELLHPLPRADPWSAGERPRCEAKSARSRAPCPAAGRLEAPRQEAGGASAGTGNAGAVGTVGTPSPRQANREAPRFRRR